MSLFMTLFLTFGVISSTALLTQDNAWTQRYITSTFTSAFNTSNNQDVKDKSPKQGKVIPPQTSKTPTPSLTQYPAQILNLTNWKLTLPTGKSGSPNEIKQPTLTTYKIDPWFVVMPNTRAVQFRAPVNGVTTSGSGYPRSELREMVNNGLSNASWSATSGIHTMILDEAITSVPQGKKHVVAGQIHDSSDDVIVIRLEYPKIFINVGGTNSYTLDANYVLGSRFNVKFVVSSGQTKVYYNNSSDPVYTLRKSYSNAYFKAGAYTQSNCSTESSKGGSCNDNNYGEVAIYNLRVTHQ